MQPQQPLQNGQQPAQQPIPQAQAAFQSSVPVGPIAGQYSSPQSSQVTMPGMKKNHHGGLIANILLSVLLVGASAFGIWSYMSMQDYKNNSDQKSAQAVEKALADRAVVADAEFAEKEKFPYDTYNGPSSAGSVKLQYPKTWSAQITEGKDGGSKPIVGFFHPGFVPSITSQDTAFALRLEVENTTYAQVLTQFESNIKQGTVSASAITLTSVPGVIGTRLSGVINPAQPKSQGTLVLFPIRDKTLRVWTDSNEAFLNDFDTAIIPNLSFIP